MTKPTCPVCKMRLSTELKERSGNGRVFLMLFCPANGAHYRAFINDRDYVVLDEHSWMACFQTVSTAAGSMHWRADLSR